LWLASCSVSATTFGDTVARAPRTGTPPPPPPAPAPAAASFWDGGVVSGGETKHSGVAGLHIVISNSKLSIVY
jgi:hypothetical protein